MYKVIWRLCQKCMFCKLLSWCFFLQRDLWTGGFLNSSKESEQNMNNKLSMIAAQNLSHIKLSMIAAKNIIYGICSFLIAGQNLSYTHIQNRLILAATQKDIFKGDARFLRQLWVVEKLLEQRLSDWFLAVTPEGVLLPTLHSATQCALRWRSVVWLYKNSRHIKKE